MAVVIADGRRGDVCPEMARLVDDDVVVEHDAVFADHRLEPGPHERIEHEERVAARGEVRPHRLDLHRQQRDLRSRHHQHGAAGQSVRALQQQELLHRVVHRLQRVAGLGHAVPLVHDVLGAEPVRMTRRPLEVVVGLHAERVGLAVAVEEAHPLRGALRHAQDAVGNVGLAAAVHLQPAAPALDHCRPGEVHAEHPRLRGIDHGVVELDADELVLPGHELIELHRLAHHRIVEEDDMDRLVQPLQHGDRRRRERIHPLWSQIEAEGIAHRQIGQRQQDADHAERGERDLAPSTPNQGAELDTESDDADHHEHRARSGQDHGPRDGLEENRLHGQRGRE